MIKLKSLLTALFIAVAFVTTSGHAAVATALTGKTVTFTVTASGTTPFTYQWKKAGTNISGIAATSNPYIIGAVTLADAGDYTVSVTNSAGSTLSDTGTLTVYALPAFTTQPVNVSTTIGGSASFTVVVTGSPAPTLQWQKGGVNIAGATSATYSIASAVSGDAGSYTVVATNAGGVVTSTAATLTVNAVAPTLNPITITVSP